MRPPLRKAFGQHHLRHESLCRPVIDFLEPADCRVVEVGPGGGVLTRALLAAGARVWAVEIDPAWALRLSSEMRASESSLAVAVGDVMELDLERLPRGVLVAGNLPYGIATRLVLRLVALERRPGRAAFLVQREVADRIGADPGTKSYGSLSVIVQTVASVERLGRVRPGSFVPPPRVESAFVGLSFDRPAELAGPFAEFVAFVRLAFARKRKTLLNNFGARWPRAEVRLLLESAGLDPARARAEELPRSDHARLFALARARFGEPLVAASRWATSEGG